MADIFISYAREDEQRARALAAVLEVGGWSVFWDRYIPHGTDFRAHIDQQLEIARCIVVLWSNASVSSQFVIDEAAEGLKDGRCVPALIERVRQPLGFRGLQAADLTDWHNGASHHELDRLMRSIRGIVAPSSSPGAANALSEEIVTSPPSEAAAAPPDRHRAANRADVQAVVRKVRSRRRVAAVVTTGLLLAVAALTTSLRPERPSPPQDPLPDVVLTPEKSANQRRDSKSEPQGGAATPTDGVPEAGGKPFEKKVIVDQLVIEEETVQILTEAPFNREVAIYVGQVESGSGLVVILPTRLLAEHLPRMKSGSLARPIPVDAIVKETWRMLDVWRNSGGAPSPFGEQDMRTLVRGRCLADREVSWNGIPWLQFFYGDSGYELLANGAVNRNHDSQLAFRMSDSEWSKPSAYMAATQEVCKPAAASGGIADTN